MDFHTKSQLKAAQAKTQLAEAEMVQLAHRLIPVGTSVSFQRQRLSNVYRIYGTVSGHGSRSSSLEITITSATGARHTASLHDWCDLRVED